MHVNCSRNNFFNNKNVKNMAELFQEFLNYNKMPIKNYESLLKKRYCQVLGTLAKYLVNPIILFLPNGRIISAISAGVLSFNS